MKARHKYGRPHKPVKEPLWMPLVIAAPAILETKSDNALAKMTRQQVARARYLAEQKPRKLLWRDTCCRARELVLKERQRRATIAAVTRKMLEAAA